MSADDPADGTVVQLYDCNGTNAQRWNPTVIGGTIGGSGALNVLGSSQLVLEGNNTYTGGTNLGAAAGTGILTVSNNNALGAGPVNLTSGTLDASGGGAVDVAVAAVTIPNNIVLANAGNPGGETFFQVLPPSRVS